MFLDLLHQLGDVHVVGRLEELVRAVQKEDFDVALGHRLLAPVPPTPPGEGPRALLRRVRLNNRCGDTHAFIGRPVLVVRPMLATVASPGVERDRACDPGQLGVHLAPEGARAVALAHVLLRLRRRHAAARPVEARAAAHWRHRRWGTGTRRGAGRPHARRAVGRDPRGVPRGAARVGRRVTRRLADTARVGARLGTTLLGLRRHAVRGGGVRCRCVARRLGRRLARRRAFRAGARGGRRGAEDGDEIHE
mmetsp:Transcript_10892/g.31653  ORF Transcript_10892/g.31653 Transcript_10892/m.31653 type:complete len:250 (-) Transcript_10892:252-1001(-)